MREEGSFHWGRGTSRALQNIVKTLIIINVIVFFLQLTIKTPVSYADFPLYYDTQGHPEEVIREQYELMRQQGRLVEVSWINSWFALDSTKVLLGQIWRLTTYDFLHSTDGFWHILFNMLVLYMAGKPVADRYGPREFLAFYLLSGIVSGIVYIGWGWLNRESVAAVGASGAVSAVLVLYAMNWPQHRWYIYGIIPIPAILLVIIAAAMDLFPMLVQLTGGGRTGNIAHAAHIGGMIFGFLYYRLQWQFEPFLPTGKGWKGWRRRMGGSRLKIHRPNVVDAEPVPVVRTPVPADVAARVDELLEKISRSGEASLTHEERQFLHDASRKFR